MKLYFILIFALLGICEQLYSTGYWITQYSVPPNALRDVYFVDNLTGWAVGDGGKILKTTDGGKIWSSQTSGLSISLTSVFFFNSNTGWVGGNGAAGWYLLKTTNGGSTWTQIINKNGSSSWRVNGIYFKDLSTGWLVGMLDFSIYCWYTTNGGISWSTSNTPSATTYLNSIKYFSSGPRLIAVGNSGSYYYTTNFTTWTKATGMPTSNNLRDVYYYYFSLNNDFSKNIIVGDNGTRYYYSYKFAQWFNSSSGTYNWNSIGSTNDGEIAVGDNGTISGGFTSPTGNHLYRSSHPDSYTGWAVGAGGTIIKYIGNTISTTFASSSYCQGNSFSTISFTTNGYFYSGNSFILQLSDSSGSFTNPVNLDTVTGTASGSFPAYVIPENSRTGNAFRVRVISTDPAVTGSDNNQNITIYPKPSTSILNNPADFIVCEKDSLYYSCNKGTGYTYSWSVIKGTIVGRSDSSSVYIRWTNPGAGTLRIIQTNSNGCKDTATQSITINSLPSPSVTGSSTVCKNTIAQYSCNTESGMTFLWTVNACGKIIGDSTKSTVNVLWDSAGTGKINVLETNSNGCEIVFIKNVTVNPLPVPVITGDSVVCLNETISYQANTGTGLTFKWEVDAGYGQILGVDNNNLVSIQWNKAGNSFIRLIETNSNGCIDTTIETVFIDKLPLVEINGNLKTCINTIEKYDANYVSGNSYKWSVVNGKITNTNVSKVDVEWDIEGESIIKLVITNSNGCSDSLEKIVEVNKLPDLPEISDTTIEKGDRADLYVTGPPDCDFIWYDTETGSTVINRGQNYKTPALNSSKSYYVLSEDNYSKCRSRRKKVTVIVNTGTLTVISTGDKEICQGNTVQIGIQSIINGKYPYTYKWAPSAGLSSVKDSIVTANPTTTTTYKLIVTDSKTVPDKDTIDIIVTVNPLPAEPIVSDISVSEGESATINITGPNGCSFYWYDSPSGGSYFFTGSSYTEAKLTQTTSYYIESEDNTTKCKSPRKKVTANVKTGMIVTSTGNETICRGSSVQVGVLSIANGKYPYTYKWSPGIGLSSVSDSIVTANPANTTTYTLIVTDSKAVPDHDTIEITVTVNPMPAEPVVNDETINEGQTATINVTGPSGCTFYWYNSSSWGSSFYTGSSYTTPNLAQTTGYYIESEDNTTKCRSLRKKVLVNVITKEFSVISTGDKAICSGSSVVIGVQSIFNGTYPYTYKWEPGSGLSSASDSIVTANPANTITYSLIVTDSKTVPDIDTVLVKVTVNPLPVPLANDTNVTVGDIAYLTATGPAGCTFRWYDALTGGNLVYTGSQISHTATKDTSFYLEAVDNSTGCISKPRKQVKIAVGSVAPITITTLGSTFNICPGDSAEIGLSSVSGGKSPYKYQWNPVNGLSKPTEMKTKASPAATTVYRLTITDDRNSQYSVDITVNVIDAPPDAVIKVPDIQQDPKEVVKDESYIEIKLASGTIINHPCSNPDSIYVKISLNRNLFFPKSDMTWKHEGERLIMEQKVQLPQLQADALLMEFKGTILLGDTTETDITIDDVQWFGSNVQTTTENGKLELIGVHEANGSKRLLKFNWAPTITKIIPNPAEREVTLEIEATIATDAELELINTLGLKLDIMPVKLAKGTNTITYRLNNSLSGGAYLVRVKTSDGSDSEVLIVR